MSAAYRLASVVVWALLCVCAAVAQTASTAAPAELHISIGARQIKFTPLRNYQELRLEIFNNSGELLYASGAITEAELNYDLHDSNGQPLAPGLYAYTLTVKAAEVETPRQHQGHFIIEKGQDQIWLTSKDAGSIGAEVTGGALTVARNPERTTAGAGYLASGRSLSERVGLQRDTQGRTIVDEPAEVSRRLTPNISGSGTTSRLTKWLDGPNGVVGDSIISEVNGKIGIGTSSPGSPFTIVGSSSAASGDFIALATSGSQTVGNPGGYYISLNNAPSFSANGTLGNMTGLQNSSDNLGNGTITAVRGVVNGIRNLFGSTITFAYGIQNTIYNGSSGNIGAAAGEVIAIQNYGTGAIGTAYGIEVRSPEGTGAITNFYGVYVDTPTTPVNKWPLYIVGGNSYFGGNVGVGVTAPTTKLHVNGGGGTAVYGETAGEIGVYGVSTATNGKGVYGYANTQPGFGVYGQAIPGGIGVFGNNTDTSTNSFAGKFNGKVDVTGNLNVNGNLSKGGGSFKIDHPLDPANKYLYHSFVESPDMKNIYDGNVTTDNLGLAVVTLPDYFNVLNRDFRYQLTVIGQFAQAIIAEEITGNQFKIATSQPNVKVSWLVTGVRQDAWANQHRIPNEEPKADSEKGYFLHPELHGQPEEKGVEWARNPELMRQLKQRREQAEKEKKQN